MAKLGGKNRIERFAGIPHAVLKSPAIQGMPYSCYAVLLYVVKKYTGYNNGSLVATATGARAAGFCRNAATYYGALTELWRRGLIELVKPGDWGCEHHPHLWGLTWRDIDANLKEGIVARQASGAWKAYSGNGQPVGNFIVKFPIIEKQRAYLSEAAKKRKGTFEK